MRGAQSVFGGSMISLRYNILPALALGVVLLAGCGPSSPDTRRESAASLRRHFFVTGPNAAMYSTMPPRNNCSAIPRTSPARRNPIRIMTQCQCHSTSPNGQITIMTGDWKMLHDDQSTKNKVIGGTWATRFTIRRAVSTRKWAISAELSMSAYAKGEFWGKAADDMLAQTDAKKKSRGGVVA